MPIVKLFANLRKITGLKEVVVSGRNAGEILSELVKVKPELGNYLFENEQIRPFVIITLNGQHLSDMQTVVMEHDQIAIFPPITGG